VCSISYSQSSDPIIRMTSPGAPSTLEVPAPSPAQVTDRPPAGRPGCVLDVTGLRKAYSTPDGDTKTVVSVARFSMAAGAQLGLKGESGSGKTTFLNLIAGIVKSDTGSIQLNGIELTTLRESQRDRLRATTLGCVYQNFNLLQGYTCLENILLAMSFGAGRDRAFAIALLGRVGLSHRLDYYPRQLSVGQQQRVAVARALANRPKLVLADEPTGNLDASLAAGTLMLLREACAEQNAALLLVSHDRDILAQFEHVAEFRQLNQPAST
jgi:ABC-type lipoprotein export system ATPase subunit